MGPSTSARATSPLQPGRLVVLLFIACCVPFAIADPKSPPPPSTTPPPPSGTKDLFPLSPADVTLLEPVCNGKVSNDNFHPCPLHGNCAFDNRTCTTPTPYSCNSAQSADLDSCKQAYGCGKAVIIKFAQGDVNSCNTGIGFGSSQGNTNSNANSQSGYYCAATSTDGPGCQSLCSQYADGGITAQPSFKCKSWVLVVPNYGDESTACSPQTGGGLGYINQDGNAPYVVTPYYGGCGWCYLLNKDACAPTCSSFGLVNSTDTGNGSDKQNIYWALYGRHGCSQGKDDPHFNGADGTRFDFNGVPGKSFCLLSDQLLHINMRMHGYFDPRLTTASATAGAGALSSHAPGVRTWIRELGFVWKTGSAPAAKHTLRLVARRGPVQARGKGYLALAEFDGAALPPLEVGGTFSDASGLIFTFLGTAKEGPYEVDQYSLGIGALLQLTLKLRVAHPLLQTPEDAEVHFNLLFDTLRPSPAVHGVLGQTYRRDRPLRTLKAHMLAALLKHGAGPKSGASPEATAAGEAGLAELEGEAGDYLSSSVLSTDCRFSSFGVQDNA